MTSGPPGGRQGGDLAPWLRPSPHPIPGLGQFLDVVHQAEELELPIDLLLPAQGEAAQALVVAQVGEDRLHGGHAPVVQGSALVAVDERAHALGVRVALPGVDLVEGHLACRCGLGLPQALGFERAGPALAGLEAVAP